MLRNILASRIGSSRRSQRSQEDTKCIPNRKFCSRIFHAFFSPKKTTDGAEGVFREGCQIFVVLVFEKSIVLSFLLFIFYLFIFYF